MKKDHLRRQVKVDLKRGTQSMGLWPFHLGVLKGCFWQNHGREEKWQGGTCMEGKQWGENKKRVTARGLELRGRQAPLSLYSFHKKK